MKLALFAALVLTACGGQVAQPIDAGVAPPCEQTEYGCSFCVPDAAPDECGNIGRYTSEGTVQLGCCVGATPICQAGACVTR